MLPTNFKVFLFLLIAVQLAGSGPAYALRIQQSPSVQNALETQLKSGAEENPDAITQQVLDWYVNHILPAKKRAARLRARVGSHWLTSGGHSPIRAPGSPALPAGQVRLDPEKWAEQVWRQAPSLKEDGYLELPLLGGEAVLFFRAGKTWALLDLFVRPAGGPLTFVGRLDVPWVLPLNAFTAGAGPHQDINFKPKALEYRLKNPVLTPSDPLEVSRKKFPRQALQLDRDSLQRLGLQGDVLADALTLAMVEQLWLEGLGEHNLIVDLGYDNSYFERLRFERVEESTQQQVFVLEISELKRRLRSRLEASVKAPNWTGLQLPDWAAKVRPIGKSLLSDGISRVSLDGGQAVLIARDDPKSGEFQLDLFVSVGLKEPVHLGRIDLLLNDREETAVARGAASENSFKDAAYDWLTRRGIPSIGPESPFVASRESVNEQRSLFVDGLTARELGIPVEEAEAALTLAALLVIKERGQDFDWFFLKKLHDDPFLASLIREGKPRQLEGGSKIELEWLLKRLERWISGKPEPALLIVDPAAWPEMLTRPVIGYLLDYGFRIITTAEGQAVLLLHKSMTSQGTINVDLFIRPREDKLPVYIGRVDLQLDWGNQAVRARGSSGNFKYSSAAAEWLTQVAGIKEIAGTQTPMTLARYGPATHAIYVDPEAAERVGLSPEQAHDMLALAALDVFRSGDSNMRVQRDLRFRFALDPDFQNPRLLEVTQTVLVHKVEGRIISAPVGRLRDELARRLREGTSQAGTEEVPEGVEEASRRVREALRLLSDGVSLRPVVVGASFVRRYPGLVALDQFLSPRVFALDPGNQETAVLVELLRGQEVPPDQVLYYGSREEHGHFAELSSGAGISAGDEPVALEPDLSFGLALRRILASLSGLTPEELLLRGMDLDRLAEDLELLEGA